jgi:hypothetical protein
VARKPPTLTTQNHHQNLYYMQMQHLQANDIYINSVSEQNLSVLLDFHLNGVLTIFNHRRECVFEVERIAVDCVYSLRTFKIEVLPSSNFNSRLEMDMEMDTESSKF